MMVLVTFLDTTEDTDGIYLVRFVDHDGLESTLQCLILFEVLLILVEGSGTDGSQFATCQGRFQNVGSIHGALATASAYQGMDFINEEDNLTVGIGYLLDDALESFLKFTLVFCTSHQCTHVERIELLVLQIFRHIATNDTLCKSLYDSGFTSTWFTDKDRVVLSSTRENLKYSANLFVTTDYWVEFAASGLFNQILGVFFETLIVLVSTLTLNVLSLSEGLNSSCQILLVGTSILQDAGCCRITFENGKEDWFHADEFVAHLLGDVLGIDKNLIGVAREIWLPGTLHTRQMLHLLLQEHGNLIAIHA